MPVGEAAPDAGGFEVFDNPTRSRFELLDQDRVIGFAEYHLVRPGVVEMPHTVIDAARRGEGLGDVLLTAALAELSSRGLQVIPACWFVADYLQRHPDAASIA
jgi:predicted GNAT family acetyltransferase